MGHTEASALTVSGLWFSMRLTHGRWSGGKSQGTWRASVRDRKRGGRLLGIIAAPTREAAEDAAVRLFILAMKSETACG
jgi:hypothetical protein